MINLIKKFMFPILIIFVFIALSIWSTDVAMRSIQVTLDYFKEMILIMPPVFILMGLMEIWVPKDKIQKLLGSGSGIKGIILSLALGTLPTGPLYVAFPMTASLLRKGASIRNMVVFLGSWAALKIPQLMVEIKFLGISFALARFILTFSALIVIGILMELILRFSPDQEWLEKSGEKE
ncbi:permease [Helicovermis profundi]|uniref:Permease n=1 Tax=Helicovermis profundi TaxID=3065157 RepID=A0AAU9E911_9FIRM|nr:permease [Clostridia bacterium S502]